jgi:hypothetical protein
MNLKFNNGKGAILCSKCKKIIDEEFTCDEWRTFVKMQDEFPIWLCKECNYDAYVNQNKKFVEYFEQHMKDKRL